jgi:hypothetical protein
MATTKTDRTTSADLAARLRERAAEYEEAGREKLRAESALLAAMANYERARYRERAAREEWERRVAAAVGPHASSVLVSLDARGHLAGDPSQGRARTLCGIEVGSVWAKMASIGADCPACLAALDEVAP